MKHWFRQRFAERAADNPQARFTLRINLLFFVIFLMLCLLVFRLAKVQFVEGEQLKSKMSELGVDSTPIPPIRGNIYDRGRYPIAYTVPSQSLYFRIEQGQTQEEVIALARRLAEIFTKFNSTNTLTPEQIIALMDVGYDMNGTEGQKSSYYTVPRKIRSDLGVEEMAFLIEHRDELPWIEITEESMREYDREHTVAVQLVGYMRPFAVGRSEQGLKKYQELAASGKNIYLDKEPVGFDGIEHMYQDQLRGQNGSKTYQVDAEHKIVERIEVQAPVKGSNLYLTIDKDVQLPAEQAIMEHLAYMKSGAAASLRTPALGRSAVAGYAVAMEVESGKVVAMASMPDYDPNIWGDGLQTSEKVQNENFFKNGTIRAALPNYPVEVQGKHPNSMVYMGSTIKPLSVLIGLKENLINVGTVYQDTGEYFFGRSKGSRITNSDRHAYGSLTPSTAIHHSSNTFMSAKIGDPLLQKYGDKAPDVWGDYLAKFGLGILTGSGLPFEHEGINEFQSNEKESTQTRMIYASWGQNERYTTLQLAQFAATLATRGKRLQPLLVDRIETYEGQLVEEMKGPVVLDESEFSAAHWNAVIGGMTNVSVQGFEGFPYPFARKTGTSTQDVGGKLIDNAVFIAFAPIDKPRLAVAVVVPEGGFGAWGAAPIARKIFDAYDYEYGLDGTPKKDVSAGAQ